MNEVRFRRRRLLADLLFAGGLLSASALLAQAAEPSPTPSGSATPKPTPSPRDKVQVEGKVVQPKLQPRPLPGLPALPPGPAPKP